MCRCRCRCCCYLVEYAIADKHNGENEAVGRQSLALFTVNLVRLPQLPPTATADRARLEYRTRERVRIDRLVGVMTRDRWSTKGWTWGHICAARCKVASTSEG